MKLPYIKFFPRDWQACAELRSCSLASRAVWIECMCLMAQSAHYGYLEMGGQPISIKALSRIIGEAEPVVSELMEELKSAGVYSVCSESGTVFSRRMVKDLEKMELGRKYGKKGGGNPALKAPPSPVPNPEKEEARSQKPEARARIKDTYKGAFIPESLANIEKFATTWESFLENRRAKKAPATTKAQEILLRRLAERPAAAVAALEEVITRNWTGFQWEWIDKSNTAGNNRAAKLVTGAAAVLTPRSASEY